LLTVADRKVNVTVANLRESLKECEIPASRHDSWIATISKYLGESGAPAVLKAPRESAPPSVRTNVKKHQRLCPPIGKEIGVEGFWPGCAKALIRAHLLHRTDGSVRLKQPQVTDQSSGSCSPPLP
jgi:hypothetical protein